MLPIAVNWLTSTALLLLVASSFASPADFQLTRFTRDPAPAILPPVIVISPATAEKDFSGATFNMLPLTETAEGDALRNPNALTGAEVSTSVPPRLALNRPPPTRFR